MKILKIIPAFILVLLFAFTGTKNSADVLREMHKRYSGKWYPKFTFTQTTEHYRNDSLVKTSTWYEYIVFPDKFRIDFGDRKEGNAVLFLGDSTFNFRNGKLVQKGYNEDNLIFLLGGMYYYPFDSVIVTLRKKGYHLDKFHENTWEGKPVYVLGADSASEKLNQLWIDKKDLYIVRFIKYKGRTKEEGIFRNHKQFGNGWSETAVDFYINDKLIQKEKYNDCSIDKTIDPGIFDPLHFNAGK